MAASLDDSRPAFNQRTYAACSNSAILVGRVGFPSTSVRQRQRADAHGAFNQRTYAACSCSMCIVGPSTHILQPAHICCLQQSADNRIITVVLPSTSAHMLLVAQRDLIRRRTLTTFNQRTYTACSEDGHGLWGSVQILQPAHICCLQRQKVQNAGRTRITMCTS